MSRAVIRITDVVTGLLAALAASAATDAAAGAQALSPVPASAASPWNGDWILSASRNSAEVRGGAADGYRFRIEQDGSIRWEIPSLKEVVTGKTDGNPMPIRRPGSTGMTLGVTNDGLRVLRYAVRRNGIPVGEGRMTLVERDQAWIDISQPFGRPDLAGVAIYVRKADATK